MIVITPNAKKREQITLNFTENSDLHSLSPAPTPESNAVSEAWLSLVINLELWPSLESRQRAWVGGGGERSGKPACRKTQTLIYSTFLPLPFTFYSLTLCTYEKPFRTPSGRTSSPEYWLFFPDCLLIWSQRTDLLKGTKQIKDIKFIFVSWALSTLGLPTFIFSLVKPYMKNKHHSARSSKIWGLTSHPRLSSPLPARGNWFRWNSKHPPVKFSPARIASRASLFPFEICYRNKGVYLPAHIKSQSNLNMSLQPRKWRLFLRKWCHIQSHRWANPQRSGSWMASRGWVI